MNQIMKTWLRSNFALWTVNISACMAIMYEYLASGPMETNILCAEKKPSVMSFKATCGSLRPLESESDVSLYWDEAISTSVDALLRFFSGLHASEISLAPTRSHGGGRRDRFCLSTSTKSFHDKWFTACVNEWSLTFLWTCPQRGLWSHLSLQGD